MSQKDTHDAGLAEELEAVFGNPDFAPPALPAEMFKIVELSRSETASLGAVAALLERNELLAGNTLRLAQSPLYATATPVTSLKDATIRLGINTIRDIVFEVVMRKGVLKSKTYAETMGQINRHSAVTGYLTQLVCKHAKISAEMPFLCGLLHDVGFGGLLLAAAESPEPPALEEVWERIDQQHETASGLITRLWELPEELQQTAAHHHSFEGAGDHTRLACAVAVAERLSAEWAADVVGPEDQSGGSMPADKLEDERYAAALTLAEVDEDCLARIKQEAETIVPEVIWV